MNKQGLIGSRRLFKRERVAGMLICEVMRPFEVILDVLYHHIIISNTLGPKPLQCLRARQSDHALADDSLSRKGL